MSNFWQRAITALFYVIILLGMSSYSPLTLGLLFALVTVLASNEFYKIAIRGENLPQRFYGTSISLLAFSLSFLICFYGIEIKYLSMLIPFVCMVFISELYRKKSNPFRQIAFTIVGIVWIAVPMSLIPFLVSMNGSFQPQVLIGCFYLIWANDTGAYLMGRKWGKNKLFERISPKKTWEGAIGGVLLTFIITWPIAYFFPVINHFDWIVIALITALSGNFGDLVESLYKRSKNIKDSGNLLPGHGGILDRFDSLLMVIPFVYVYLLLFT